MDTIRRVEELSYAKGISLAQLARMSGVSNSTLKNARSRNYQLSVDTIERLCAGLGITMSEFFDTPVCRISGS